MQLTYAQKNISEARHGAHADCDVYWIETPTGPGGMSGPLRVDLEGRWTGSHKLVMREYSWHEAEAAFQRTAANHRQSGWGPPGR